MLPPSLLFGEPSRAFTMASRAKPSFLELKNEPKRAFCVVEISFYKPEIFSLEVEFLEFYVMISALFPKSSQIIMFSQVFHVQINPDQ